ncbi:shikimate kinase [Sulfitobacter sp. HNIBRBA2951]|uniref:shikimate kinase n=1 Tax=Sulfitobacter aquimarinus TaxID=3158557 RepID=UPI0032DEB7D9
MGRVSNTPDTDDPRHALTSRLARRVREVRKQKGLPRRVVSELSGVSHRYLAQLEAGEGNISVVLLERVARALGVPIEALIAQKISVTAESNSIAALYDVASDDVKAQVRALLRADRPTAQARRMGRICLLGLRGAGKSTLGNLLSKALGIPMIKLDTLIEGESGMPLREVRTHYGADGVRRLEAEALDRVIAMPEPVIITVSGVLVEQDAAYARLRERFNTIWLRTSLAEHVARTGVQGEQEPPLSMAQVQTQMEALGPLYALAQAQLDTSGQNVQSSLQSLLTLIRENRFIS